MNTKRGMPELASGDQKLPSQFSKGHKQVDHKVVSPHAPTQTNYSKPAFMAGKDC